MPVILTAKPKPVVAWDLSAFSYDGLSFPFPISTAASFGFWGNAQGDRFYATDDNANRIRQVDLSTDWDITTASGAGFTPTTHTTIPSGVALSDDGLTIYIGGNSGTIYSYPLGTAWEVTTRGAITALINLNATVNAIRGIRLSPDGTKIYLVNSVGTVFQYTLPTPWVLSGMVYSGKSWVSGGATGIDFKTDGLKVYRTDSVTDTIHQHPLSVAWDISTVGASEASISTNPPDTDTTGLVFRPDGTRFMMFDFASKIMYQYSA